MDWGDRADESAELRRAISGVLVIDKPVGMSSHDVVQAVRRGSGIRRVGHTGTLDPRASGVLVVLVGSAVRLSEYLSSSDKEYQAVIRLGRETDTYDSEGRTLASSEVNVSREELEAALQGFVGEFEQEPPPFSAIKVKGKRAYDLARQGKEVDLAPRKITVYSIDLLEWDPPEATISVACSSGTYIRSLAHDLGQVLGCGAMLAGLRRTRSGRFTLRQAVPLSRLEQAFAESGWASYLLPAAEALSDWPSVELSEEQIEAVRHGMRIPAEEGDFSLACGLDEQGELVALLGYDAATHEWMPKKVLFDL